MRGQQLPQVREKIQQDTGSHPSRSRQPPCRQTYSWQARARVKYQEEQRQQVTKPLLNDVLAGYELQTFALMMWCASAAGQRDIRPAVVLCPLQTRSNGKEETADDKTLKDLVTNLKLDESAQEEFQYFCENYPSFVTSDIHGDTEEVNVAAVSIGWSSGYSGRATVRILQSEFAPGTRLTLVWGVEPVKVWDSLGFVDLVFNHGTERVRCLLDTGANSNIIGLDDFQRLRRKPIPRVT
uniref:Uncharacterized protein n=1 Tax=Branchiostoma floridae TaxID=7739 RepID=C3ZC43_BRAFL|eukprot:XP_002593804.1 hypothetical protein BRAFLDRAFT_75737 [Branchiostoma floridae]